MQEKIKKTDPDKRYRRVLSASTLAGDRVRNAAGDDLGAAGEETQEINILQDTDIALAVMYRYASFVSPLMSTFIS